jgi:hypothetical protein
MRAALVVALLASGGFPAVAGQREVPPDTNIRLERTSCFGECPVYSVTIDAHGNVVYDGQNFVRIKGRQSDRIPVTKVRSLLDTADRIGFFDLDTQYRTIRNPDGSVSGTITDLPTTFVTVTSAGRSKRVEDYFGTPKALRGFEREIDTAARTSRWIRIDESTLKEMARGGSVPPAAERAELLRNALLHDDVDVVRALLELGADPNGVYYGTNTTPLMMVRSGAAARLLIEAGADPFARNANGFSVWHRAIYLGPEVAEVLVRAGAPVDAPADPDGRTALWLAACGGNAGVVSVLLAAGADPSRGSGSSPLSAVDCAREGRENSRRIPALQVSDTAPPFTPDYDHTVVLLQDALARQKKR